MAKKIKTAANIATAPIDGEAYSTAKILVAFHYILFIVGWPHLLHYFLLRLKT
jgi:hypothetical protein